MKDSISSYLIHKQISVLEINAYLDEMSEHLKERILPTLSEYGIKLLNFYVNDINVPEDDSAVIKLKEALAKRAEMDIVGYNYVQQRSFDTLEGAATNPSSGQSGLMRAGIGIGMGAGVGGVMGSQFADLVQNINTTAQMKNCPNCNALVEERKRFCSECGYDTNENKQEKIKEKKETVCSNCGAKMDINIKIRIKQ